MTKIDGLLVAAIGANLVHVIPVLDEHPLGTGLLCLILFVGLAGWSVQTWISKRK